MARAVYTPKVATRNLLVARSAKKPAEAVIMFLIYKITTVFNFDRDRMKILGPGHGENLLKELRHKAALVSPN